MYHEAYVHNRITEFVVPVMKGIGVSDTWGFLLSPKFSALGPALALPTIRDLCFLCLTECISPSSGMGKYKVK